MSKPRTHAFDNVRSSLTALVILHHTAIPYGGAGSWLYTSPRYAPGSSVSLVAINATNQTFFMATFFLLSAYFSSIAARKRMGRVFLEEKWTRLGVPTLVYSLLCTGLIRGIIAWRSHNAGWPDIWRDFVEGERSIRGVTGPVWYCALLFIFDVMYTVAVPSHFSGAPKSLHVLTAATPLVPRGSATPSQPQQPFSAGNDVRPFRTSHVISALCLTSTSSFVIRLNYPVGRDFVPLSLQLAFVSQYILYYTAGIYIHRSGRSLENAISLHTIAFVAAAVVVIYTFGVWRFMAELDSGMSAPNILGKAIGGPNTIALIYAFWNEFMGLLLCSGLLRLFTHSRLLSRKWSMFGFDIGRYSYAAFLVHAPLVVDLQCWFGRGALETKGPVVTSMIVGTFGTIESWIVGFAVKESVEWMGRPGCV